MPQKKIAAPISFDRHNNINNNNNNNKNDKSCNRNDNCKKKTAILG